MSQNYHEATIRDKHLEGSLLRGYAEIEGVVIHVRYSPAIGWFYMDADLYFHFIDEPSSDRALTQCDRIISTR